MMHSPQIGEVSAQAPSILIDTPIPNLAQYSGLLGNQRLQKPILTLSKFDEVDFWLWRFFNTQFVSASPASRLALLKQHTFTAEGRAERIKASLDALNAPQPTTLTLQQWGEVIAEAEEDED